MIDFLVDVWEQEGLYDWIIEQPKPGNFKFTLSLSM